MMYVPTSGLSRRTSSKPNESRMRAISSPHLMYPDRYAIASSGYSVKRPPSISERMKNTRLLSIVPVDVRARIASLFFLATAASRQILAANSVFPEPIGPMTRTRLPGVVKSKWVNVSWTSSVGNPRDLRKSAPGVVFSIPGILFPYNSNSRTCSNTCSTGINHSLCRSIIPHAAGCLDTKSVSYNGLHEFNIM